MGECLECSFRLTRGGPYLRGVIGSTVGAYPRGTGSNPAEGNGHFSPSYRQLYLSSFSDTHTHTVSSIFRLSLTHTHTHTQFGVVGKARNLNSKAQWRSGRGNGKNLLCSHRSSPPPHPPPLQEEKHCTIIRTLNKEKKI